jgi:hypothetical protein
MPGTSFTRRFSFVSVESVIVESSLVMFFDADSMARTAARTTPSFLSSESSSAAFEVEIESEVSRQRCSSSPARNTSYAANQCPPRRVSWGGSPALPEPPTPGPEQSAGSATTADRRRTYPRALAPAGNKGHPSRTVTHTYPEAFFTRASVTPPPFPGLEGTPISTRVEKGARPHISRGGVPEPRDPSPSDCDRNAKPPHSP